MARYNPSADLSPLYNTMERFKSDCLIADGSVLSPERQLWTPEGFAVLERDFVQNLDTGEGNFFGKLEGQMANTPRAAKQLMSELIWLLYAFQRAEVSTQTKDEKVRMVWSWSGEELPPNVPPLSKPVLQGVGRAGMGYNNNKWRELVMLITAMQDLKTRSSDDRKVLVTDPVSFSGWLDSFDKEDRRQLRHVLNFLLFPDYFERISAGGNKREILVAYERALQKDVKTWRRSQLDDELFKLRKSLEAQHGSHVDFYEGEFLAKWRKTKAPKKVTLTSAGHFDDGEEGTSAVPDTVAQITAFALNTIFYGPPGTGKTFFTAERAVLICSGTVPEDKQALRARYAALQEAGRIGFVTFHQSYTYEDFVEGMRPVSDGAAFTLEPEHGILRIMAKRATEQPDKNFVLIIDEINRANIAKVLGELITLLEDDKRIGGDAEVTVTLPYSKHNFALPPNLYFIGTMNTADRSISLLDTALRRRFIFEEIAPDTNELAAINLDDTATKPSDLLTSLNKRLSYFLGEEAQLGHAWFMSIKSKSDLDRVMAYKIIPLLKEYFHDDHELLYQLLGGEDGFISREEIEPPKGVKDLREPRYLYRDRYADDGQYDEEAYAALIE